MLIQRSTLTKGYWDDPKATDGTIKDGWLYTGDLATVDDDGFVRITGRKKDLIVTSGGDNIAPSKLESMLSSQAGIEQAAVFGDSRPWLGAILIPTTETAQHNEAAMEEILQNAVDLVNSEVAVGERIRKFIVQTEICTTDNGMLTPTQKVKRGTVFERHLDAINNLY